MATAAQPESGAAAYPQPVHVNVARSVEDVLQALAVRAPVFLSEKDCPYAEEYDGNDFMATHILGFVGDEPASTCRLRYFARFARLERVAVRRQFRKQAVAGRMIEFAPELCRRNGYRKVHGQAEEHLVSFWGKFGFKLINPERFTYNQTEYFELECDLDPHPDPITIGKGPLVLSRPEGAWDEPAAFEPQAHRSGTDAPGEEAADEAWARNVRDHLKRLG